MSQRLRIQNLLVTSALAVKLPPVFNDTETMLSSLEEDEANFLFPNESTCNETAGTFDRDTDNGRALSSRKTGWAFELRLSYPKEVDLTLLEEIWLGKDLYLAPDGVLPALRIRLNNSRVNHPPKNQPATGTRVIYFFQAEPLR